VRGGVIAALVAAAALQFVERGGGDVRSSASATAPDAALASAAPAGLPAEFTGVARPRVSGEVRGNLFAGLAGPTVRQPPAQLLTAKAAAPAFPYKYGGRLDDGSAELRVYLKEGGDLIAIRKGDMLDEVWRVDGVSDDRIEVSFVPSGQQFSMLLASLVSDTPRQVAASASAATAAVSTPAGTVTPPAAGTSVTQPPSAAPTVAGAVGLPLAASLGTRPGVAAPMRRAPAASPTSGAGPGDSFIVPTGRLGIDAPTSGSMPTGPAQGGTSMQVGPAPSGSMPTGPAPTGKLGL